MTDETCLLHFERLFQLEAEGGLRRQDNVLVASKRGAAGSCAAARECADGGALAASRQAADQRAQTRATARQDGSALTFAFFGSDHG